MRKLLPWLAARAGLLLIVIRNGINRSVESGRIDHPIVRLLRRDLAFRLML